MCYTHSDFAVTHIEDYPVREYDNQLYNLSFFNAKLIKGILSTEGHVASLEDIELLTTNTFNNLQFSQSLNEQSIQDVWAMNKALYFLQAYHMQPITVDIIKEYNRLILVGPKAQYSGALRKTNVNIRNSTYCPPDFRTLERLLDNIMLDVDCISGDINKAFSYLLALTKSQLFIDGNKRTAIMVSLHHLTQTRQPLLMFFDDKTTDYIKYMEEFYETGNNTNIVNTLFSQLDINR